MLAIKSNRVQIKQKTAKRSNKLSYKLEILTIFNKLLHYNYQYCNFLVMVNILGCSIKINLHFCTVINNITE